MEKARSYLWIFIMALVMGSAVPVLAQNAPPPYSAEQLAHISAAQTCLRGADALLQVGSITPAQRDDSSVRCLAELSVQLGQKLAAADVLAIPIGSVTNLTALQRAAGYVTWHNTVWFFVTVGFGGCVLWLCWSLVLLLRYIPKEFYELCAYGVGSYLIYHASREPLSQMEALLGSIGVFGGLMFSKARLKEKFRKAEIVIPMIMTGVFGVAAVFTLSSIIGYFAVATLVAALGFSVVVLPGVYVLGYNEDNALVRTTIACFLLLGAGVVHTLIGKTVPHLALFAEGIWLVAGIVGYLGLLIITNRWFWSQSGSRSSKKSGVERQKLGYWMSQIVMVAACGLGLWFGSIYHVTEVQKIAGTFLVLWALEKPFEIKAESAVYYAATGTVVFGLLYWLCTATATRPSFISFLLPL